MIEDLQLRSPDYTFKLRGSSPLDQLAEIMLNLESVISKERTRIISVEGDTNTIVAAALAGLKMGVKVSHVESGLRSRDWRMPERT